MPLGSDLLQDLRFGLRSLRRNPGFAAVSIATLALGVGANTAIFCFVDAVLLRPLPYPEPDRIVRVMEKRPDGGVNGISTLNYLDWAAGTQVFEFMAAQSGSTMTLSGGQEPVQISSPRVSAHYFDVFGAQAALGRTFAPDEDQVGKEHVLVINRAFWRGPLSGDPHVLGRRLILDGEPYTIIGVLPAGGVFDRMGASAWRPLTFEDKNRTRDFHWLSAVARLKPGVSLEQARAQMSTVWGDIENLELPVYVLELLAVTDAMREKKLLAVDEDDVKREIERIGTSLIRISPSGVYANRKIEEWNLKSKDFPIALAEKNNWKMAYKLCKQLDYQSYVRYFFIEQLAKWGNYRTAVSESKHYNTVICENAAKKGDFSFIQEAFTTPNFFSDQDSLTDAHVVKLCEIAIKQGHYEGVIRVLAPLIEDEGKRVELVFECLYFFYQYLKGDSILEIDPTYDFERAFKIAPLLNDDLYKRADLFINFINEVASIATAENRADIKNRILAVGRAYKILPSSDDNSSQ